MTKKLLSIFLSLMLILSVTFSASSFAASAAEDSGEVAGSSNITDYAVMYVGDTRTFTMTPTYKNINYGESGIVASSWDVITYQPVGEHDVKVIAEKPGTVDLTITIASYNSSQYSCEYDILTVTINVLAASQRLPKTGSPANVRIQNKGTGLYVTWDLLNSTVHYKVFYKKKNDTAWNREKVATNSLTLENLDPGELYYIQVQSLDNNGADGGYSKVSSMTHVRGTTLKSVAYNSNASVTVGWDAAGGANMYEIAKKKLGETKYTYFSVFGTTFNDKDVECGTIYYYQVRPYYTTGKSAAYARWSNTKTITTLYRPTITNMNITASRLNINWNKIKGVTKYKVAYKRATDSAWNYRETTSNYYNVANPTPNVAYYVQVCPMNGNIAGQYSTVGTITLTSLTKPTLKTKYGGYYINLNWNAVSGATGYQIAKKAYGASSYTYYDVTSAGFTDYNFVSGSTYYYQVRAVNGTSYGPWSSVAVVCTLDAPVVYALYENGNYIDIGWYSVSGALQYKIAYKKSTDSSWSYANEQYELYSIYNPPSNTKYFIQICAMGQGNVQGPWSAVNTITTAAG